MRIFPSPLFHRSIRAPNPARAAVRWVPGEDVLLLAVSLPPMPVAQARVAVAFAVEDRIARPLDEVHVVLGGPLPGAAGTWLVGVIARDRLALHIATLRPQAGPVVPDTVSLPVPDAGHWAARELAGRVLLRFPDGTGMAVPVALLPMLHRHAGAPGIVLHGGTLPAGVGPCVAPAPGIGPEFPVLDLRSAQGRAGLFALSPTLRRAAMVAGVAAVGHLALLGAETALLSQRLATRDAALRSAMAEAGLSPDGDVQATLARAMAGGQAAAPPGVLPILSDAMAAMAAQAGQVTMREVQFAQGALTLTLQAPDLGTLQAVEGALGATMTVSAGAATRAQGLAEQQLVVTQ